MEKLLALLLACGLCWGITPWVRKLALIWGAVDKPEKRKIHNEFMPRLGGLSIYFAFISPILLFMQPDRQVYGLLVGITIIIAVGIIDDIHGLSPWVKLAGQLIAAISVVPFGLQIFFITNPLNGNIIELGWWGAPVTLLWLITTTNAVNLIDGLDGLAGGVSCIAALTMAVVGFTQWKVFGVNGQQEMIMLALLLASALLGFLPHNFYPARIFLGDSGSMLLGFSLAAMAVMGLTKSTTAVSVLIPVVILGIPLMDTLFAILRRYHRHRPIFQADREHLHHKLLARGFTHRQAVLIIYGASIVLGASAVILNLITTDWAMVLVVILAMVTIAFANKLGVVGKTSRVPDNVPQDYH